MKKRPKMKIVKKLAEGGQGEVYIIKAKGNLYAFKLYNKQSATDEQRAILEQLVADGVPAKHIAHRFAWTEEILNSSDGNRFGYRMPLVDRTKFVTFADIESKRVEHPGFGIMAEACRQFSECFREIHIAGYCYRDISKKNFFLSPTTGDIIICDNDNIVINGQTFGGIKGTTGFMAPEVVLETAKPSKITDLHSLAVLLFMLMCGGHPFHGKKEYGIKIFDGIAARHVYGLQPVFVFDPKNRSNRLPNVAGYRHVAKNWKILPWQIRNLFVRAFTVGLNDTALRVTDIEWQNAFTQLLGHRHICSCGAENFWDLSLHKQQKCWHKGCTVDFPPKLYIKGRAINALLIKNGQQLTTMHVGEKSNMAVIGEIETKSSLMLLRNRTQETWKAVLGNQQIDVPSSKAIPLHPGLRINALKQELIVYP